MAIQHTIAGLELPQTRTSAEVLADMETTVQTLLSHPTAPPCPEHLIADGLLAYAYEPKGRDDYTVWWLWPQVHRETYCRYRENLWHYSRPIVGRGIPSPQTNSVAIDDCDGFATHGVAWHRSRGRRAWPVVQEFRTEGKLRGWHALMLLELRPHQRHVAEIAQPELLYVLDTPYKAVAENNKRLVLVDLAWMGGMPRHIEGRFNLQQIKH